MKNTNNAQSILITGCSSGIGYHVAKRLQQTGYYVIATARKTEDVDRLNREGLLTLALDLDDSESIRQAFHQTMQLTKGKLFALFNNGAYGQPGAVEDLTRETLRAQLETNLLGWHELSNLALKVMRQQNEGRILYNSSVLGFVPMAYRGAYNCSKFALEGLVDTLRLELKGSNIFVSLIEPGPIESLFRKNAFLKFQENIDPQQSHHKQQYEAMQRRLEKKEAAMPFTLPPEAVFKVVLHGLQSKRPKIRYPVTFPTYLFAVLKRLLPTRLLDRILLSASGNGKR